MSSQNVFIYLFTRTKHNLFIDFLSENSIHSFIHSFLFANIFFICLFKTECIYFLTKTEFIYLFDILTWLDLECRNLKFEKFESFNLL